MSQIDALATQKFTKCEDTATKIDDKLLTTQFFMVDKAEQEKNVVIDIVVLGRRLDRRM